MGTSPRGTTGGGGFSTGNTGTSSMAPRHYSFGRTDYSGIQGKKLSGPAHASAIEGLFDIAPGSLQTIGKNGVGGGAAAVSAAPKGPPTGTTMVPADNSAVLPGQKAPAPVAMKYYTSMDQVPATGGYMKGSGAGLNWVVPPPKPVAQPRVELASLMGRRTGGSGSNYGDRSGSTTSGGRGGFGGSSARSGGLY